MASEKVTAILEEIKAMTVLDLSELVHAIEDEFGVSAAAPVAVAAAGPAAAAAPAEEKTEFDVVLAEVGAEKIKVIKVVRRSNSSKRHSTLKTNIEVELASGCEIITSAKSPG